jgi:hypothetical protein
VVVQAAAFEAVQHLRRVRLFFCRKKILVQSKKDTPVTNGFWGFS